MQRCTHACNLTMIRVDAPKATVPGVPPRPPEQLLSVEAVAGFCWPGEEELGLAFWPSLRIPAEFDVTEADGVTIEAPPLLDSHSSLWPDFHALVWHGFEQYRGALGPEHALHRLSFRSVPSGCPQKLHVLDISPIIGCGRVGVRGKKKKRT